MKPLSLSQLQMHFRFSVRSTVSAQSVVQRLCSSLCAFSGLLVPGCDQLPPIQSQLAVSVSAAPVVC